MSSGLLSTLASSRPASSLRRGSNASAAPAAIDGIIVHVANHDAVIGSYKTFIVLDVSSCMTK